jgi:2',3'-cyclic-nucleotide 2'-phosphodiesterase (5'-nucleotidase family)
MIRILHTNDMHGTLENSFSGSNFHQLSELRKDTDLYFDSGDCIKKGNLAIPTRIDPVWQMLSELHCTASVIGNRETHPIASVFEMKIKGIKHPVLCGNLKAKKGESPLPAQLVITHEKLKIGIVTTMVAMVTEKMKTQFASSFLWGSPIKTIVSQAKELRPEVDVLFALTHIGFNKDQKLAERCPEIDVIFGGHSHTVLPEPVKVNRTWIVQGGSHNRFAGVYDYDPAENLLTGGLKSLSR